MTGEVGTPLATSSSQAAEQFPRSKALPRQSPLFWVAEKDRYLRQLLVRDIQEDTGRALLVYFASNDPRAQIGPGDDAYFAEMIRDTHGGPADLLIETSGGWTDTTEKIASLLRNLVGRFHGSNHMPSRAVGGGYRRGITLKKSFDVAADMMRFTESVV